MKEIYIGDVRMWPTNPTRLSHLRQRAEELAQQKTPLRMLEVGSLLGDSALVLAPFGQLTCVDPWDFEDGLEQFLTRVAGLHVYAIQGSSRDILPTLPAESFDLVYIDGDHTFPSILTDLEEATRLVAPGGVICGDDLEKILRTEDDILEASVNCHLDYLPSGYHPGVSYATWLIFRDQVHMLDGFWWVTA